MTRDYAAEIAQKEVELSTLKTQMSLTANEFSAATGRFLATWYPAQAKREVEHDSDTTLKQQPEGLAAMKREISDLVARADVIAREFLDRDKVWWHQDPSIGKKGSSIGEPYWTYQKGLPDILSEPVRYAMGVLAKPLEARGYLTGRTGVTYSAWRKDSYSHLAGPTHYYPCHHDWPEDMLVAAQRYCTQYQEALKLESERDMLQRDKQRTEAGSLWDSL